MSEEKDNTQQPSPEEQLANTIRMQIAQAFNTGLQSQPKEPVYHLSDVVKELETFFTDEFKKNAGENVQMKPLKPMSYFLFNLRL